MKKIIHQFTETGEVRVPRDNEWYYNAGDNNSSICVNINTGLRHPILTYEKIIEDWKPTNEDYIFFINAKMEIEDHYRAFHYTNEYLECLIKANNCFPTKELAEEKLKQIKDILKGVTQ